MKTQRWKLLGHRSFKCLSWGLKRKMVFLFPCTNTTYVGRKWYFLARYDMVNFLSCRPEVTTSHAINDPALSIALGWWWKTPTCLMYGPRSRSVLSPRRSRRHRWPPCRRVSGGHVLWSCSHFRPGWYGQGHLACRRNQPWSRGLREWEPEIIFQTIWWWNATINVPYCWILSSITGRCCGIRNNSINIKSALKANLPKLF